jgi:hypothetical protein
LYRLNMSIIPPCILIKGKVMVWVNSCPCMYAIYRPTCLEGNNLSMGWIVKIVILILVIVLTPKWEGKKNLYVVYL